MVDFLLETETFVVELLFPEEIAQILGFLNLLQRNFSNVFKVGLFLFLGA